MFKRRRLNKIIAAAVEQTVAEFHGSIPAIYKHLYYGAFDIAPQYLVIWYLFTTDTDLQTARESGLCDRISAATIRNLISAGYPEGAFAGSCSAPAKKITIIGATDEQKESGFERLTRQKPHISFTTQEDIDREAHGDYHLYFQ